MADLSKLQNLPQDVLNNFNGRQVLQAGQAVFLPPNLGNPGIIDASQIPNVIVGNAIGAIKEEIYKIAIKNTEALQGIKDPSYDKNVNTLENYGEGDVSKNGTLLFDSFTFESVSYKKYKTEIRRGASATSNGTTEIVEEKNVDGSSPRLPVIKFECVLISANRSVEIIQTKTMNSSSGTVKEYMGSGEWEITLNAHIFYPQKRNTDLLILDYDSEKLKNINLLPEVNVPIPIRSRFLRHLGVSHVVVTNLTLTPVEGMSGVVQVQISMISDTPIKSKL